MAGYLGPLDAVHPGLWGRACVGADGRLKLLVVLGNCRGHPEGAKRAENTAEEGTLDSG